MAVAQPTIVSVLPNNGGITDSNVLTLFGTATPNSIVDVFDGTTLLGTATVNGNGIWTFTAGTLSDGTQVFTAVDSNSVGNPSATSSPFQMTVTPDIASFSSADNSHIYVDGSSYWTEAVNPAYSITSPDTHTLRFEVHKGDVWGGFSGERAEIAGWALYSPGTTIKVSYNFAFEPGVANPLGIGSDPSWVVVGQFHSDSNTTTPQPVHPPFAIFMSGKHMEVNIASAATGSTVETDTTLYLDPNPIQRGHYYAITIEANFQNNANGFLEVWRDGTEIVNYHGAIGYGQSVYWKEGIYRSPTTVV